MADPSLAEMLLTLARRDEGAYLTLAAQPGLHDSLAGFHAQQAVEKALKAVLARSGIAYRRTHDIGEIDGLDGLFQQPQTKRNKNPGGPLGIASTPSSSKPGPGLRTARIGSSTCFSGSTSSWTVNARSARPRSRT